MAVVAVAVAAVMEAGAAAMEVVVAMEEVPMMLMVAVATAVPIQTLDGRNVVDHRKTQSRHQVLMVRRVVVIILLQS